ncbi:hypothetical protein [Arthrobacter sp. NPDC058192]|uniref:hypothetical protein n=1 Tax=Arthrobacter sp. NPDC058192 TaxID=3346372 RepID=UPI0036E2F0FA
MKRRRLFLIMFGMLIVVLTVNVVSRGSGSTACPATGYGYTGDVELVFAQEPASVAACFGEGCTPAPVTRSADGRWLVPQSAPYLAPAVSVTSVFVDAVGASGAHIAHSLPIETEPTGEQPDGPGCGGPFRFKPVHVP